MSRTRRITNMTPDHTGGLAGGDGAPLVGIPVSFILCNQKGEPSDAWDITTGGLVITSEVTVPTDEHGEFEVNLWPTGLGTGVFYMCRVAIPDAPRYFIAPLDFSETDEDISWYDWQRAGKVLVPTGIFSQHIQNETVHLSAPQHAALAAAHSPSADNPFATLRDVPQGVKDVVFTDPDTGNSCTMTVRDMGLDDEGKRVWSSQFVTVP